MKKLELSLVGIMSMFDSNPTLVSRKRIFLETDDPMLVVKESFKFLNEHVDSLLATSMDTDAIDFIRNGSENANIADLFTVKIMMTQAKLDLVLLLIDTDDVTNIDSIPKGFIEFNVLDKNLVSNGFVPSILRHSVPVEENLRGPIYKMIYDHYAMFDTKIGKDNLLKNNIDSIIKIENVQGTTNRNLAQIVEMLFSYLGKEIIIINPPLI